MPTTRSVAEASDGAARRETEGREVTTCPKPLMLVTPGAGKVWGEASLLNFAISPRT